MDWIAEMEDALGRAENPVTVDFILRGMRSGDVHFFCAGELHGAIYVRDRTTAVVAYLAGKWTDEDGAWIICAAREKMRQLGCKDLWIEGRPGWRRFLRMKGYLQ